MSILAPEIYDNEFSGNPIFYDLLAGRDIFTPPAIGDFEPWQLDEHIPAPLSALLASLTPTSLMPIIDVA